MRAGCGVAHMRGQSAPRFREKHLCIVHGVDILAAQHGRRIASPRTYGASRACHHLGYVSPLVKHREMTRCAPRRREGTRYRRYDAHDRLKLSVGYGIDGMVSNPVRPIPNYQSELSISRIPPTASPGRESDRLVMILE